MLGPIASSTSCAVQQASGRKSEQFRNPQFGDGQRAVSMSGHCPPFARTSATHKDFGEEEAPKVVLRRLWASYCLLNGKERAECPYHNMWDGPM